MNRQISIDFIKKNCKYFDKILNNLQNRINPSYL